MTDTHAAPTPADDKTVDLLPQAIDSDLSQMNLPDIPLPPEETLPTLMSIRLAKQQTVEEVSASLRLSVAQIHALEAHRWSDLPGAAYIKGFLRNYARFLNVDAQPYLDQYHTQTNPIAAPIAHSSLAVASAKETKKQPSTVVSPQAVVADDPAALSSFSPNSESHSMRGGMVTLVVGLLIATAGFLLFWERAAWLPAATNVWHQLTSAVSGYLPAAAPVAAPSKPVIKPESSTELPAQVELPKPTPALSANEVTPATMKLPVGDTAPSASSSSKTIELDPTVQSNAVPATSPAAIDKKTDDKSKLTEPRKPATGPIRAIAIDVSKDVWIEVRDSADNILNYGNKSAGSKQIVKGAAPLSIVIGAADAVTMSVDGKNYDVKSLAQGNVARFKLQ